MGVKLAKFLIYDLNFDFASATGSFSKTTPPFLPPLWTALVFSFSRFALRRDVTAN